MISPNKFYIAGSGLTLTFRTSASDNSSAGIGSMHEGKFVNRNWVPGLRIDGDKCLVCFLQLTDKLVDLQKLLINSLYI